MRRQTRLFVTWIAALAVLLHAFLPLAHAAMGAGGIVTTLCSADGNKRSIVMPVGDGGTDSQATTLIKCPLCAAGAHIALTATTRASFAVPDALRHVQSCHALSLAHAAPRGFHFSPRAPPLA